MSRWHRSWKGNDGSSTSGKSNRESARFAAKGSRKLLDGIAITFSGDPEEAQTEQKTACCFIQPVINKFTVSVYTWRNRVRSHGRNERLEPYVEKFTCTVRGGNGGNAISLTRRWKRGLRYGTLICDLENNRPIDILVDRSVQTVSAWFEKRPSVEIVSRDRSSEYAAAISKGAPQALQVADLWHIGKNLSEGVQTLLARCRPEIRRGLQAQAVSGQEPEERGLVLEEERSPARSASVKLAGVGRRAQKQDRYMQVVELHRQGVKAADIASRIGIGERTVYRWLAHGSFRRPPDSGADDRASSTLMSAMCSNGGSKGSATAHSFIKN